MGMIYAQPAQKAPTSKPAQLQPLGPGQLPAAIVFANAKKPFGGLVLERETQTHAPAHENDLQVQRIMNAWKRFREKVIAAKDKGVADNERYGWALEEINGIACSASDLARFMDVLPEEHENENIIFNAGLGIFISALVNTGPDCRYVIRTDNLEGKIIRLGYLNTKDLEIYGDVGQHLGEQMTTGTITVYGNAAEFAAGTLKGGIVRITGGTAYGLALWMEGGEVHVEGDCDYTPSSIKGGKIFVHGKQVKVPLTSTLVEALPKSVVGGVI